jgi:uncharacterized protein (TIGR03067 family)
MKWRIAWVVFVLVAAVAGGYALFRGSASDHARLQGDWNYSTAGRNNLGIIRVEGDVWSYRSGGPHGRSYRLTLRPDATPREIDLALLGDDGQPATFTHGMGRGGEVKLQGIYEFNGSTVRLALSPEKRPANFDDDETPVLVLTR